MSVRPTLRRLYTGSAAHERTSQPSESRRICCHTSHVQVNRSSPNRRDAKQRSEFSSFHFILQPAFNYGGYCFFLISLLPDVCSLCVALLGRFITPLLLCYCTSGVQSFLSWLRSCLAPLPPLPYHPTTLVIVALAYEILHDVGFWGAGCVNQTRCGVGFSGRNSSSWHSQGNFPRSSARVRLKRFNRLASSSLFIGRAR